MQRTVWTILSAAVLAGGSFLFAGEVNGPQSNSDRIDVIAHVPATGKTVVQLTLGSHWEGNYVYLGYAGGRQVTILDVTDPAAPRTAGQLTLPSQEAGGNLSTIVGTAALVASAPVTPAIQTVTILNFADPAHPTVVRQFSGVTALLKDSRRGITYIANPEGLWVLRADPATDLQVEKQYEHHVVYSR